jgi:hypothetical protein
MADFVDSMTKLLDADKRQMSKLTLFQILNGYRGNVRQHRGGWMETDSLGQQWTKCSVLYSRSRRREKREVDKP